MPSALDDARAAGARARAASRDAKIAPKIATPNEPPIERKNVAVAVATPMFSRLGVVLDDEHEHLHHEADADADDEHVDGREPRRRAGAEAREQEHADDERRRCPRSGTCGSGRCG